MATKISLKRTASDDLALAKRSTNELEILLGEEEPLFSDTDEEEEYHNQVRLSCAQSANTFKKQSHSHIYGITNVKEQILSICCDKCKCCRKIKHVLITSPLLRLEPQPTVNYDSGIESSGSTKQKQKQNSEQNKRSVEMNILSCQAIVSSKFDNFEQVAKQKLGQDENSDKNNTNLKVMQNLSPRCLRNLKNRKETDLDSSLKTDKDLETSKIEQLENLLVDGDERRKNSLDKIIDSIKKKRLSGIQNESNIENTQSKKRPKTRRSKSYKRLMLRKKQSNVSSKKLDQSNSRAELSSQHESFSTNKKDELDTSAKKAKLNENGNKEVFKVPLDTNVNRKTLPAQIVKKLGRTGGIEELMTKPIKDFRSSFDVVKKVRKLYTPDLWLNSQEFNSFNED